MKRATWCSIASLLLTATLTLLGCNALDELADTKSTNGPVNRAARQAGAECYDTFPKFKAAMNRAGRSRANDGMQWHHIVPQHSTNVQKFGAHDLHCTDNLVYMPEAIHVKVSAHYSTTHSSGKSVRDWLKDKDFDEQYDYGVKVLREHKIEL
ncbi:hypothetical protein [Haliangium sp.]|uniref:hypothetical protein n=1 Tax=Haliangium sp. TaxID=2663208 RepID=UPI003D14BFC3